MFLKLGKKSISSSSAQEKTISFEGKVWNSCIDSSKDIIVIETRDEDQLTVKFHCIDIKKGKELFCYQHPEHNWWIGLKYAHKGFFVLSQFQEDSPLSKGIFVIDSSRGVIRWKNNDYSFLDGQKDQIMVADKEKNINLALDIESGSPVQFEEFEDPEIKLPQRYLQDTEYFKHTAEYIKITTNDTPFECIEHLETENLIISSYYSLNDTTQENHLIIADLEGKMLKKFQLQENQKGIGYGDFIVFKNTLIFITNNKNIKLLPLSSLI